MQKRATIKTWIWLIIPLIIVVISSYFIESGKPREYPVYVSESPSPTGIKAFYTYVKNNHEAVERWPHSPTRLPKNFGTQTLIMVEPYFTPDRDEMDAYIDFMEAGNTILLLKNNPKGMFDLSVEFVAPVDEGTVYDQKGEEYLAEMLSNVRLLSYEADDVLLSDDEGTIAFSRSIGEGKLIVATTPEWLTNENILEEDHLPLILSLMNEGEATNILFDEYIHGAKGAAAGLAVYPMWFLLCMLQAGLLTILFLWAKGKRFGPIFNPPREDTVRFSDEGIKAISAWYIRGRRYHESLVIQADYLKRFMQERWRIPYQRNWLELADSLKRKMPTVPAAEIEAFLKELTVILNKEKVSKQEYLLWSKKIDRMRREVEEG
ncbi:DUF4350 domain-containing protein [Bacillus sp. FJAT-50079]|uniref:DUF4350 domain-containing protein n=1 Tax=Bacillus sp. FJAT-50079 TaxID=2833577 RepID=UPI001BC9D86D|nr:DUF4350 domain-containing protein [Bacillus sp. FJAT-50079]MBS4208020.1 DUF4350 domain-containing protein [Bacillus sp. FJAT-50079]